MDIKKYIREIPDFPVTGINFKDITTLLKEADVFRYVVDKITRQYRNKGITKVITLESRGFIVGGALAYHLRAGFVPIRKKGKLPAKTVTVTYDLEYGSDIIEIHEDALSPDDIVLIHDDLLATGGTAMAALNLVRKFNVRKIYFSFICDLDFLDTPNKQELKKYQPHILVSYE